jgi:hypothetical protein
MTAIMEPVSFLTARSTLIPESENTCRMRRHVQSRRDAGGTRAATTDFP